MFGFLAKLFAAHVKMEWEAKLHPTPECQYGGKAEVEIETQAERPTEVEASVKYTSIPDGSQVEIRFGGKTVMTLVVHNGYAKQKMLLNAEDVPAVQAGDTAELCLDGNTLYQGTFRKD